MIKLAELIKETEAKKIAIGHFNISTIDALWGIVNTAKKLNVPVIIGVSEGERDFIGVAECRALITSIQKSTGHPVYLNGDHTYSFERVKELVDAGFDSVIFDGSELPMEENIKHTKQCVDYVRASGTGMLIEGELGYIGKSSKMLDAIPENATVSPDKMTQPDEIRHFIESTGVDLIAPAVGNIHGMLKNAPNPNLNIPLIKALREAAGIPIVLHGGSGISEQDFKDAITAGISMIHINTELRKAWRDAIETCLIENKDEVSPYKIMSSGKEAVSRVVQEKLTLFNNRIA